MVPFVPFAGPSAGLGQATDPALAPGSWREFAFRLAQPFAGALSQRIAYGTPPPYGYPTTTSSFFFQPGEGAPYYGTGFGGFDPKTLLLLGGGVALLMMLSRR